MAFDCKIDANMTKSPTGKGWVAHVIFFDDEEPEKEITRRSIMASNQEIFKQRLEELWDEIKTEYESKKATLDITAAAIADIQGKKRAQNIAAQSISKGNSTDV